ncbi:MAG: VWA domain-containing protein [Pirellulales bacterium]|nr:VWA domain-containing protein [Pirellulales bacterium]
MTAPRATNEFEQDRPGWLRDANSMLVSAFCHLMVFIVLGLMTVVGTDRWGGVKLQVNLEEGPNAPLLDGDSLDDAVELEVSADPAAALGPTSDLQVAAPVTTAIAELSPYAANALEPGGAEGRLFGGGKQGDGTDGKAAARFFGIGGYGQTFVYVVDASSSMGDRGKFDRARYELLQSIEQLQGDQRYFIVFYSDREYPMDAEAPLEANQRNFARTAEWVRGVEPSGGTNPLPALLYALSLRPDAIYFLSDGQFDPDAIKELRSRNRGNTRLRTRMIPIHTIAFFDRIAEGLMRTIARNSGGEYRYVH